MFIIHTGMFYVTPKLLRFRQSTNTLYLLKQAIVLRIIVNATYRQEDFFKYLHYVEVNK